MHNYITHVHLLELEGHLQKQEINGEDRTKVCIKYNEEIT